MIHPTGRQVAALGTWNKAYVRELAPPNLFSSSVSGKKSGPWGLGFLPRPTGGRELYLLPHLAALGAQARGLHIASCPLHAPCSAQVPGPGLEESVCEVRSISSLCLGSGILNTPSVCPRAWVGWGGNPILPFSLLPFSRTQLWAPCPEWRGRGKRMTFTSS